MNALTEIVQTFNVVEKRLLFKLWIELKVIILETCVKMIFQLFSDAFSIECGHE